MRSSTTTTVRGDGVNGTAGAHGSAMGIDEFRRAPIVERDIHVADRVRDVLLAHPDTGVVADVLTVRRELFEAWTEHVLMTPGHWAATEDDDGHRVVLWPRWLLRYGTPAGVRAVARLLDPTTTERRR